MERPWKGSGKAVERPWKGSGKAVERQWKGRGKAVERQWNAVESQGKAAYLHVDESASVVHHVDVVLVLEVWGA